MQSLKYRITAISLLIVFLAAEILFAGTTGKIAGKIIDKETGEPLPGVNVMVKGTTLGSTTDIEGYYAILQVPPGVHSVAASMVGYAVVTINEVRVLIDQTTPLDIEMSTETIQMTEVTVTAGRNVIRKDVSTSVTAIQPDEIQFLPATTINDLIGLQAGVEEGLIVRGGGADELLFEVDGITFRDPRNNKPITSVALTSIQEVSIERGGFNAEYGQVRSGIVNVVSKEGDPEKYFGAVQVKYSPPSPKHFGMSVYDVNSMWSRPYLDPEVAFTGTQNGNWDMYTQRQYPVFQGWNTVSQALLSDNDPSNDLSPAAAQRLWMWQHRRRPNTEGPDYNIDASFGGPVPFISDELGNLRFFTSFRLEREMLLIPLSRDDYQDYSFSLKINSDLGGQKKLMVTGSYGKSFNVPLNAEDNQFNDPTWGINGVQFWNPTDFLRSPYHIAEITNEQRSARIFTNSWYSEAEVSHITFGGKFSDWLSTTTFYELSLEGVHREYLTGPIDPRDTTRRYEIVPGYFVDESPFGFDVNPVTGIGDPGFFFGGHSSTVRDSSVNNSYVFKADITSQFDKVNMIKAGVEFSYFDLNLDFAQYNQFFSNIIINKANYNPYRIAAYVQDKIEAFGFTANVGVRMDLSNPNTEWVEVDDFDEFYYNYSETGSYPTKKSKIDFALSPRVGISHNITEDSKLYFNYGHFKQLPAYEEIFRTGRTPSGELRNFGDPDLEQALTISYELGYDHNLFDEYVIQLSAFYNDTKNQQAFTQFQGGQSGYFRPNNNSYEDVRGLEVTLKKSYGSWIRGFATYTYQVSSQGAFGRAVLFSRVDQQRQYDRVTSNLYQLKPVPQPRANISLTFLTPADLGPEYLGFRPLGDWNLSVIGQWEAGEYLTYNPKQVLDVVNNVQVTDYSNIDLRLNKIFDFGFMDLMLFMEVRNLLNAKMFSGASFYDVHDQRYYMESLHLPSSAAYDNIPGEDKLGDYRQPGVPYQPVEIRGNITQETGPGDAGVIYWNRTTNQYMEYVNGGWAQVDNNRMQKILDDKAYIDMPNNSSFTFLNPRQFFFGINLSFKL